MRVQSSTFRQLLIARGKGGSVNFGADLSAGNVASASAHTNLQPARYKRTRDEAALIRILSEPEFVGR